MKKLQTILAAILCAAMVIASVPAALADDFLVVVDNATCQPGNTDVEVAVYVENNPGFFAMALHKIFPSELKYAGSDAANTLIQLTDTYREATGDWGENILIESLQQTASRPKKPTDYTRDGDVVYLYFDIPADVRPGDYTVSFTVSSANNNALERLDNAINIVSGTIHVEDNGSLNVADYKGDRAEADWTYPTQAGKVFAGWYTDSTYSTVYTETTGMAFPRFVDEKVAMVQAQKLQSDDASKATIRFISTLDTTEYDSAGFKITVGSKTATAEITKLYRTITAGGVSLTPSRVSGSSESQYITLFKLSNIPSSRFSDEITTVAFWKTKDGTVVTSNRPSVLTVDDFKDNYINAIAWDI